MPIFSASAILDNAIKETGFKLKAFAAGAASHVGLYSKSIKALMSYHKMPELLYQMIR